VVKNSDGTGSNLVINEIAGLKLKISHNNIPAQDTNFKLFDAILNKKVNNFSDST